MNYAFTRFVYQFAKLLCVLLLVGAAVAGYYSNNGVIGALLGFVGGLFLCIPFMLLVEFAHANVMTAIILSRFGNTNNQNHRNAA